MDFSSAKKYILRKLKHELPKNLHYHGLHHTWDVYNSAQQIAIREEIDQRDKLILYTASLYHDAGFIKSYHDNEPIAVEMINQVLPDFGYGEDEIKIISEIILSTKISVEPKNELECIMCDADHDYFGRSDYHVIADSLYRELGEYGQSMSEKEWVEQQIEFLTTRHKFYTDTSIEIRLPRKKQNLLELKDRLTRL